MNPWTYAIAIAVCLTACANENRPQVLGGNVATTPYLAATADMRFVFARPKNAQAAASGAAVIRADWPVDPNFNVCAEPSPDIAKALADALTASAKITADGLKALGGTGANVTVSPEFSMEQNASLTELGRRLATTQLLRDGVYRLCEAYSNGAISSQEYALVLSRYGDTMVTLLAIEAVTGMADKQMPASAAAAASAPAVPKQDDGGGAQEANPGGKGAAVTSPLPTFAMERDAALRHVVHTFLERPFPTVLKVADRPGEHADVPNPASGGQANGVNADRVAAARAVVELQKNYLKQSAYAPLIVLCTETLSKAPPSEQPENSLAADCNDVLHSFIKIQSVMLAEEALKANPGVNPKAVAAKTPKKADAHP